MREIIDETGKKYGDWEVISFSKSIRGTAFFRCRCKCGTERDVSGRTLRNGTSTSCGHAFIENGKTHGLSKHPLYHVWDSMRQRCNNPKHYAYIDYGKRGIGVCGEWNDDFKRFYDWSMNNGYENGLSLDRKNNDEDYMPTNCRYVTMAEQNVNRRKVFKNSRTGVSGVTLQNGKYRTEIGVNYKRVYLGTFDTLDDAISARLDAEKKYWGE